MSIGGSLLSQGGPIQPNKLRELLVVIENVGEEHLVCGMIAHD
jgi:hypothetical protein